MATNDPGIMIDLTMADFDMLGDAIFQRAGDADTAREEDRWLTLSAKLRTAALELERQACACGHARKSHRGDGKAKCIICHCLAFDRADPKDESLR